MIAFQLIQTIDKPQKEVFDFLSDVTNMSLWNYYVRDVTKISEGPGGIGTLYAQRRAHDLKFYKVIERLPRQKIIIELQPPAPLQRYGFELEDQTGGTLVKYNWQVDLRRYKALKYLPNGAVKNWLLSFAGKHVSRNIKPATEQNFLKLKTLLETGSVTLQDGRTTSLKQISSNQTVRQ